MSKKDNKADNRVNLLLKEGLDDLREVKKINDDFQAASDALEDLRPLWRENEKLFFNAERGKVAEEQARSNVNDAHLSTAVIQRTQRIMAQPPTGKVEAFKGDRGKSMLMQLILDRYIKPNANAQFTHATKLKLWTIYSQIYGDMDVLADYIVSDRYIGPDFWLIPRHQSYPQPGVFTPNDRDYHYVDSFVSSEWLARRPTEKEYGWKNLDKLVLKLRESGGHTKRDYEHRSYGEETWGGIDEAGRGKFKQIRIRTKYMRDRWVTYVPDFLDELGPIRDIKNPHDNDRLPIVTKHTIPLLDRATGLGDIERGAPTQKALNSFINLTMDTVKYSLFPPTIVNRNGVVPSSMRWYPGAFWHETIPGSIRQHQMSPQGINTFNNIAGFMISNLNNMLGTSDLSVQKDVDPAMGKTPQAVKMQAARESAADAWERDALEEALEDLYDRFVNLVGSNTEKPIDLELMEEEIIEIAEMYPDVTELYDGTKGGRITIKPDMLKGEPYRFTIDHGSTIQRDTAMQNQELMAMMMTILSTRDPQTGSMMLVDALRSQGKDINLGELVKGWLLTSNLPNKDKIITDYVQTQPAPGMEGMSMPGQGAPQAGMGQVPPEGAPAGFQDPEIDAFAQQLFGGAPQGGGMNEPGF